MSGIRRDISLGCVHSESEGGGGGKVMKEL